MGGESIAARLDRVRQEVEAIRAREGVHQDVRIVAVTKGHAAGVIREAVAAGLEDVGENRVQEAVEKQKASVDVVVRWHLIGHLQTNKARLVPGAFAMVHSVDSWRVAEALALAVEKLGTGALEVLLQVNVAGESQKSGCPVPEAPGLAQRVAGDRRLSLRGLMVMAPLTDDERVQRRVFAGARQLRDSIASTGLSLPELSMGMSADYRAAVAEGATMLRLGTELFGERQ